MIRAGGRREYSGLLLRPAWAGSWMRSLETASRILIIRPSALGDVCRSVPVLASLRAAYPSARIDWLVRDRFEDAVSAHPALSGVVAFQRERMAVGKLASPDGRRTLMNLLRGLRDATYDIVYDCQGLGRSGFFAAATRAPVRVGFADARELGWAGLTRRVRVPRNMHTVDRMLALVESQGVAPVREMRLHAPERDRVALDPRVRGGRCLVVAPTSAWAGKRWPAERFAAAIRRVLDERAADVAAVVGGPGERDQCGPVLELAQRDPRVIDLVGKTSVGGLMAVVEQAALVLANDSACVHMAVGFDRPMVALYGPTRIDLVGPYRREADVIQAIAPRRGNEHKNEAAGRAAMEAIDQGIVEEACLTRLRSRGGAPSAARGVVG